MPDSNCVAQINGVEKSFLNETVLRDISFDINRREIVTLIGPNGSGKTTLVRILLGILKQDKGSVFLKPGIKLGYVPQKVHFDPSLPITVDFFLSYRKQVFDKDYFKQVIKENQVEKLLQRPVQRISGGELQRVLLSRALLNKPDLLILDEPAQGVDVTGQEALYQRIASIRQQYDCAVLMVSHDLHLVMASTDKVICLNQHVCCSGAPSHVTRHPEYLKLFGSLAHSELALYTHQHDHQHDTHGNIVQDSSSEAGGEEHKHG